eukprot:COSAG01_NODE_7991_length_2945_cov_2.490744_3_plen_62_part_00
MLSFREQTAGGALSQYMYEGRIEMDGCTLSGRYKHRFFPCAARGCSHVLAHDYGCRWRSWD